MKNNCHISCREFSQLQHIKIWAQLDGFSDTKQNEIWPLTFICITKMASYQLDVFMWFDWLVTLHMHTKFGQFMMIGYEDMNDHVKTQNGTWMTSWLSDHTEKRRCTIPMMPNILWKFEHDCTVCFWDKWITKFVEKLFVYFSYKNNFSLEVICHADKLRWYASTEWIENLTTFPTSDWKLKTTSSIAHSLSYDILYFGRKYSHNNRDTAQRSLPCRFMFWKKCPPIDITRKYEKLCIFAFNRKFDYDDVIQMKINVICIVENCLSYNI